MRSSVKLYTILLLASFAVAHVPNAHAARPITNLPKVLMDSQRSIAPTSGEPIVNVKPQLEKAIKLLQGLVDPGPVAQQLAAFATQMSNGEFACNQACSDALDRMVAELENPQVYAKAGTVNKYYTREMIFGGGTNMLKDILDKTEQIAKDYPPQPPTSGGNDPAETLNDVMNQQQQQIINSAPNSMMGSESM